MLDTIQPEKTLVLPALRNSTHFVVLTTLAINFLSLAMPVMTLQVYDRVLPNNTSNSLELLIIGVCCAIFLETILKLSRAYIIGWTGASFEHLLSCKMMQHFLNVDLKYLQKHGVGADLQRMTSGSKLKEFYSGELIATWLESAFVIIFLVLIWYIGGMLVLVPLAVLGFFSLLTIHFGKKLKQSLIQRNTCDNHRYNFLVQALSGIHTIKAFGLEHVFCRRYEFMEQESTISNLIVSQIGGTTFNGSAVFSHLMIVSVISFGALRVIGGDMTVGALVACILLSGRIMQPVQKLLQMWIKGQDFELTQQQIQQTLDTPLLARAEKSNDIQKKGLLELKNLHFRYIDQETWLLKDISLKLKPGDTVHVAGLPNSGRSTLLKLIAGIYTPEKGRIIIDNHTSHTFTPTQWSRHVAYLSDSGVIFRGTIRDNLTRFGAIDIQQTLEIARALGIQEDVARLPAGFDTHLEGTLADSIPPGLKQRIVIARSLAPKPRIILFDHADHALDRTSYTLFLNLLKTWQHEVAMLIVSDDSGILDLTNKQYRLYDGQLTPKKIKHSTTTEEVHL